MEIVMPKMGESVNEGTIIKWHKKVGDKVKKDEIIFEISTDKVDTEIPAPASGTITEIKVQEGDTVDVGTVVAVMDVEGETPQQEISEPAPAVSELNEVSAPPVEQSKSQGGIVEIEMPKMGESVMEGTIIKWHKKVGDKIARDETLFEISTDKVDTEVPSPVDGVISEILVAEQETVEVGTIVARIAVEGAVPPKQPVAEQTAEVTMAKEAQVPAAMHDNFTQTTISADVKEQAAKSEKFYSPLVLNIARKENISFDELERIQGSGLNGRVTKKDILTYVEQKKVGKVEPAPPAQQRAAAPFVTPTEVIDIPSGAEVERIPMDNIRQRIMEHMIKSRDTSVHVTSLVEVDMLKIEKFIKEKKDEYYQRDGVKLTYMAFIADACVKALKAYPLVNSSIDGTTIIRKKYINLGIAVAVEPTGLLVPNIKAADQRNIIGLAKAINDLAARARNKKLTPDDITGGTFTITNYGVFGTVFGNPIINQPEVAILGVGAVIKRPVVIEVDGTDAIAIRPVMALTLSHDHRLIDGMLGSLFLKYVKDTLENFDPNSL